MKGWMLCFFINLQFWSFISCEEDEGDDGISVINFTEHDVPQDLIDPFSFDYDRSNKKMANTQNNVIRPETAYADRDRCQIELTECRDVLGSEKSNEFFIKRIINMLLANANLKGDDNELIGSVLLTVSKVQLEVLQKFGDQKVTVRQVDAILSNVIRPPRIDVLAETLTLIDHIRFKIYEYERSCIAVLTTLFVCLLIKYVNWTTGKIVIILLAIIVLFSFFITWLQLIKKAEIQHFTTVLKHGQPPIQCQPEKMNWWHSLTAYLSGEDECAKYYEAVHFEPLLAVTPIRVLTVLIEDVVFHPIAESGGVVGSFIENSTKHLSWPAKWIVSIVLYVAIAGCIIILPLSLCGGGFGISLGPLFRIFLRGRQTTPNTHQPSLAETREPITVILQVQTDGKISSHEAVIQNSTQLHRPAIAAVEPSSHDENTKGDTSSTICKNRSKGDSLDMSNTKNREVLENRTVRAEIGDGDQ